jgi:hypothetical protein
MIGVAVTVALEEIVAVPLEGPGPVRPVSSQAARVAARSNPMTNRWNMSCKPLRIRMYLASPASGTKEV